MSHQTSRAELNSKFAYPGSSNNWILFGSSLALLLLFFIQPLKDLYSYGQRNELYSHCWLIPFVCLYLAWIKRADFEDSNFRLRRFALVPCIACLSLLFLSYKNSSHWSGELYENYLACTISAFVMGIYSIALFSLGEKTLRQLAFPLFLLLFTSPFPVFAKDAIQVFLQYTSAETAYWMIKMVGTTIYRDGLVFQLSSVTMEVAPQCSGIRSSLVLFITSLIASHLFLTTFWKQALIIIFVVPLAIIRNGLRIFTLGQLCELVSPDMINSWVHHKGGPLFFAISLVPFFMLLFFLRRTEPKEVA